MPVQHRDGAFSFNSQSNRYVRYWPQQFKNAVLSQRQMAIDAWARDRTIDPNLVRDVAVQALRLGRIPEMGNYGLSYDDSEALAHFISDEFLNIEAEECDSNIDEGGELPSILRPGKTFKPSGKKRKPRSKRNQKMMDKILGVMKVGEELTVRDVAKRLRIRVGPGKWLPIVFAMLWLKYEGKMAWREDEESDLAYYKKLKENEECDNETLGEAGDWRGDNRQSAWDRATGESSMVKSLRILAKDHSGKTVSRSKGLGFTFTDEDNAASFIQDMVTEYPGLEYKKKGQRVAVLKSGMAKFEESIAEETRKGSYTSRTTKGTYPFRRKEEHYKKASDESLYYNAQDSYEAMKSADSIGDEISSGYYADEIHTISKEMRRRGLKPKRLKESIDCDSNLNEASWSLPYRMGQTPENRWTWFYTDTMTGWYEAQKSGRTYDGKPKAFVALSGKMVGLFVWDEGAGKHKIKKKKRGAEKAFIIQAKRINSARSKNQREKAREDIVALVKEKGVINYIDIESIRGATEADLTALVKKGVLRKNIAISNVRIQRGPFAGGSRTVKSAHYRLAKESIDCDSNLNEASFRAAQRRAMADPEDKLAKARVTAEKGRVGLSTLSSDEVIVLSAIRGYKSGKNYDGNDNRFSELNLALGADIRDVKPKFSQERYDKVREQLKGKKFLNKRFAISPKGKAALEKAAKELGVGWHELRSLYRKSK